MDRISAADYVDIGDGRRGFRDQNKAAGLAGTVVNAAFLNAIQEEVMAVIEAVGLEPAAGNWTQLLTAIRMMIDDVRVAMPIYPEVLTGDGKLPVTEGAGKVTIAANTDFVIRGGKTYTTTLLDLPTAASKIYHLRWTADAGFALYDLSNIAYNPTAAAETNAAFDTSYDNMLVARVTTDPTNVATITKLVNRAKLIKQTEVNKNLANALNWTTLAGTAVTLNWSRTPVFARPVWQGYRSFTAEPDGNSHPTDPGIMRALEIRLPASGATRYGIGDIDYWYEDSTLSAGYLNFVWSFQAD